MSFQAVGMSIYASAAARAAIYEVDFEEERSEDVLREVWVIFL